MAQDGLAADFNICTFPYYGCNPTFNNSCITVSEPVVDGQLYTFDITSSCAAPLNAICSQTLYKIEFNTCRWRQGVISSALHGHVRALLDQRWCTAAGSIKFNTCGEGAAARSTWAIGAGRKVVHSPLREDRGCEPEGQGGYQHAQKQHACYGAGKA